MTIISNHPQSQQLENQNQNQSNSFATTNSNSTTTALEDLDHMNRREIRGKHLIDQSESLEDGYGNKEDIINEKERLISSSSSNGLDGSDSHEEGGALSSRDKRALALLIALYLLQGIPVGLAFGSIPFLLRAKLSYSQIGIFTLCTYPYSLKLLWSPIVDSIFLTKLGRRKSWIVPIQLIVGIMFYWLADNVEPLLAAAEPDVNTLTILFFTLIFFAATQDIAVDGWALTLLSKDNLSYASTAQTIGLNTGYFLSFTVFLAFNSLEFSNAYFRSTPLDYPLISLSGYLRFWAFGFVIVTAYLAFFQPEDPIAEDEPDMDLAKVYTIMWDICQLKHVQTFILIHLVTKFGTAANDAATSLKLLEKGLKKEDLALAVLIDFPFQIFFGYLAAKWSKGEKPLNPWLISMWTRLGWALISMLLIHFFPQSGITNSYFFLVVACTVGSSFSSTVQFVGISAFHTQIADPLIGGTYMTLLNTVSNLGGTWPRFFVLKGVDALTVANCIVKEDLTAVVRECVTDHGKAMCTELAGECVTVRDGYYLISTGCILAGAAVLYLFVQPEGKKLQALPLSAWRVKSKIVKA